MQDHLALNLYSTRRDPAAFRVLVERYQTLVYAACRRRLADAADVDDAAQETFLRLARHASRITVALPTWLYVCATNIALDRVRRNGARRRHELAYAQLPSSDADRVEWQQLQAELDNALAELDDEDRDLIVGHYLLGHTQQQLAAEMRLSQPTVHRRLKDAIRRLRQAMQRHGCTASLVALTSYCAAEAVAAVPPTLTIKLSTIGLADVPPLGPASVCPRSAKLKGLPIMATVSTSLLLAAAGVAWLTLSIDAEPPAAAATTAPAATAPATAPAADFSTPFATFRTYVAAIQAGDRPALAACFEPPPPGVSDVTPIVFHNVYTRRIAAAVAEQFGPAAVEEVVPYDHYLSDRNIVQMLANWPAPAEALVVEGDRAHFVDAEGHRFGTSEYVKIAGAWKMAQIYPDPSNPQAVARYERWLDNCRQLERDLADLATDVELGEVMDVAEVRARRDGIRRRFNTDPRFAADWSKT